MITFFFVSVVISNMYGNVKKFVNTKVRSGLWQYGHAQNNVTAVASFLNYVDLPDNCQFQRRCKLLIKLYFYYGYHVAWIHVIFIENKVIIQ